jgi:hypothetical protein
MRLPWAWRRTPLALPERFGAAGAGERPCVVHLVWAPLGIDALRAFAEGFRRHPPGIECELVLAMKGFASPAQAEPYLEEVVDLAPKFLFFADRGLDLGGYFAVAAQLRRDRYCFVNSYSRPLVDGWLAKLNAALDRPGVGQVGATGVWASGYSWIRYSLGLPSAYRGLMPPPAVARRLIRTVELRHKGVERRSAVAALRAWLVSLRNLPAALFYYEPFPSRNLRSNAFMITHATLGELPLFVVRNKMDTYALEGSRESLTRQLERIGLTSLVVDRAGAVYGPGQWDRSRTLWQGDQEGLLVSDNQTRNYTHGDLALRQMLSVLAWGPHADPSPPAQAPSVAAA